MTEYQIGDYCYIDCGRKLDGLHVLDTGQVVHIFRLDLDLCDNYVIQVIDPIGQELVVRNHTEMSKDPKELLGSYKNIRAIESLYDGMSE